MDRINVLTLALRLREGGSGATPRAYLDFVVDGEMLSERVAGDLASCLGWFVPEENAKAVRRLLPECGDLGCGAVSVVIEVARDQVIWRDFGFQNNYEDKIISAGYAGVGPLVFDKAKYEAVIRSAS